MKRWQVLLARLQGEVPAIPEKIVIPTPFARKRDAARENPLRVVLGELVRIDNADRASDLFAVASIDVFEEVANGQTFHLTEYSLHDRLDLTEGEDGVYRYLRMVPNGTKNGKPSFDSALTRQRWTKDPEGSDLELPLDTFLAQNETAQWLSQHALSGDGYEGFVRNGSTEESPLTIPVAAIVTELGAGGAGLRNVRYFEFVRWKDETHTAVEVFLAELNIETYAWTTFLGETIDTKRIKPLRAAVLVD